jgi:hypothetical protein
MVSVESPLRRALAEQVSALEQVLVGGSGWPSPEYGLALYLFAISAKAPPRQMMSVNSMLGFVQRLVEAPVLAAGGYALAIEGRLGAEFHKSWAYGLKRLSRTRPFAIDRETFFYRPIEVLGISLGARACAETSEEQRAWLRTIRGGRR